MYDIICNTIARYLSFIGIAFILMAICKSDTTGMAHIYIRTYIA